MFNLFNSQTIIATGISGLVAITVVLIQSHITLSKQQYEAKANFSDLLKTKLEHVYTPLSVIFIKTKLGTVFINDEVSQIIIKYGHLLSRELFTDLRYIYRIESAKDNNIALVDYEEYENLKNKVSEELKYEFQNLQELYNKTFHSEKEKIYLPWYRKALAKIGVICASITVIFYLFLLLIYFISSVKTTTTATNNILRDSAVILLLIIVISTTFSFFMVGLFIAVDKVTELLRKSKRLYFSSEYVPKTGEYECRICNLRVRLTRGAKFPICCKHSKMTFKKFLILYKWRYINENVQVENVTGQNDTVSYS